MRLDRRHIAAPPRPPHPPQPVRLRAGAAAAAATVLAFLTACASTVRSDARVQELLLAGDLTRAYWVLQDAVEANPDDADLRRQLAELRTAYHLRQGQEKVFIDDDWGAVEEFERVLVADPGNVVAKQWKDKALAKLAERAVAAGDDARSRGKLEDALKFYHQATTYVPGHPEAVRGTRLVSEVFTARRDKGQTNYVKGMRAQAGGQYEQTQYHMQIALDNDPSLAAAEERRTVARRQLAQERLEEAKLAEERGLYETALREYKAVAASFPELFPDMETKLATMQREVDAATKLNQGTLLAQRGDFVRARTLLEQAYEASSAQRGAISAQLVALREADLEKRYIAALDLELDYHYEDALRAYQEIDASWPGQLDVRTRMQNLESSLELAREAQSRGEAAEAKGDLAAAVSAYREALTYVPKFADLGERIERLKKKAENAPPPDGAPAPVDPAKSGTSG